MIKKALRYVLVLSLSVALLVSPYSRPASVGAQELGQSSIVYEVRSTKQKLQMTVNTSRILKLPQKIPQAQVNNPEILDLTAISPNEVQISAKDAGVTQVNLWDENQQLYTIDVVVYADVQALDILLKSEFPGARLRVIPVATGVMISGYVDNAKDVKLIHQIAEEYFPKVIDNMTVAGVQQVALHVRVMEVSRTKLRNLGFDWTQVSGANSVASGVAGLISAGTGTLATSGAETFAFGVVDGGNSFFGVLEAMRQDNLVKILAEPTLIAQSGETAHFASGGEFPIVVPQSLGTTSIEYKSFGTEVDFVPIVLGDGRIHLEVKPRVSEIDTTTGDGGAPGLRVREVKTAVELRAGQTLALAGLVQSRVESQNRGMPWISEVPYLGVPFRRVHERVNEIELLIMVTPELVDPLDPHEVPQCGPGMQTTSPSDWQLYLQGHLEVPNCCPTPDQPNGSMEPTPAGDQQLPPGSKIISVEENPIRPGSARATTPRSVRPSAVGWHTGPTPTPGQMTPGQSLPVVRTAIPQYRNVPPRPQVSQAAAASGQRISQPGLIGPVGYDVVN
ncbi:MAG: pilus assembly protein N-terminal domain-containing protein [Candidatus Nealsonbacteria bacterium]|nr:pilus assembly protein N-terminal domain-containing protein [Candidatus Nealsonbacteria bacterium]